MACKWKSVTFRKLKNMGETRWSGQYETMESVLYLKDAIRDLADESDEWSSRSLDRACWKLLEGCVVILKDFRDTVKI